jgi:hypothetical protein
LEKPKMSRIAQENIRLKRAYGGRFVHNIATIEVRDGTK